MHPTNDDTGASMEMPRYISHKRVWALEIKDVLPLSYESQIELQYTPQSRTITFVDKRYAPIWCPPDMFSRYMPVSGDYYVQYADGYKSFSPRKAFLEGYKPERDVPKRPTIAELEEILKEPDSPVRINPDGSVERI